MTLTEPDRQVLEKLSLGEPMTAEAMDHCESIAQLMVEDLVRLDASSGRIVLTELGRRAIEDGAKPN